MQLDGCTRLHVVRMHAWMLAVATCYDTLAAPQLHTLGGQQTADTETPLGTHPDAAGHVQKSKEPSMGTHTVRSLPWTNGDWAPSPRPASPQATPTFHQDANSDSAPSPHYSAPEKSPVGSDLQQGLFVWGVLHSKEGDSHKHSDTFGSQESATRWQLESPNPHTADWSPLSHRHGTYSTRTS